MYHRATAYWLFPIMMFFLYMDLYHILQDGSLVG